jgi:hypothetical protein
VTLMFQESIGKLHHGALVLLLGFNYGERWRICLRTAWAWLLGLIDCGRKSGLKAMLFIGVSR